MSLDEFGWRKHQKLLSLLKMLCFNFTFSFNVSLIFPFLSKTNFRFVKFVLQLFNPVQFSPVFSFYFCLLLFFTFFLMLTTVGEIDRTNVRISIHTFWKYFWKTKSKRKIWNDVVVVRIVQVKLIWEGSLVVKTL